jgi:hypothetical protein
MFFSKEVGSAAWTGAEIADNVGTKLLDSPLIHELESSGQAGFAALGLVLALALLCVFVVLVANKTYFFCGQWQPKSNIAGFKSRHGVCDSGLKVTRELVNDTTNRC